MEPEQEVKAGFCRFQGDGLCEHWTSEYYTENISGRPVYKDECAKCFETPKGEAGLDVCLKCLVGGCNSQMRPDEENHSRMHYAFTGHPLVANFRYVLKEKDKE